MKVVGVCAICNFGYFPRVFTIFALHPIALHSLGAFLIPPVHNSWKGLVFCIQCPYGYCVQRE